MLINVKREQMASHVLTLTLRVPVCSHVHVCGVCKWGDFTVALVLSGSWGHYDLHCFVWFLPALPAKNMYSYHRNKCITPVPLGGSMLARPLRAGVKSGSFSARNSLAANPAQSPAPRDQSESLSQAEASFPDLPTSPGWGGEH